VFPVVRHEERVANKDRITHMVGDTCRRMSRDVNDFSVKVADFKFFIIFKQPTKLAAINFKIITGIK